MNMTDREVDQVVKIQGTIFDRKRKLAPSAVEVMQNMRFDGNTYAEIGEKLGITATTVRYSLMTPEEKSAFNKARHLKYGKVHDGNREDRIAYKRDLLEVRNNH